MGLVALCRRTGQDSWRLEKAGFLVEPWLFVVQKVRAGNINVLMQANRDCEDEYQRTRSLANTCTSRKRQLGILERAFKIPIPCLIIPRRPRNAFCQSYINVKVYAAFAAFAGGSTSSVPKIESQNLLVTPKPSS